MALNSLECADVPLRNYSLTNSLTPLDVGTNNTPASLRKICPPLQLTTSEQ